LKINRRDRLIGTVTPEEKNSMKTIQSSLLALTALFICVSGCGRTYSFSGVVVDGNGNGIADARIVLFPSDWKRPEYDEAQNDGKTESDGTFEAGWCCATGVKFFRMVTSKSGYHEDVRIVSADEKNLRVVLSLDVAKTE
jgi:hypothetical protein